MSFQIKSASFYKSVFEMKNLPENNFPQIAFAGRSNVGKSSLLNALVEQKNLAKTSSTPGKTQMLNFFLINNNLFFVDLPGYGYAQAPKKTITRWGKLIEDYIQNSKNLKGLIQIIDIRHPTTAPTQVNPPNWNWGISTKFWLKYPQLIAIYPTRLPNRPPTNTQIPASTK